MACEIVNPETGLGSYFSGIQSAVWEEKRAVRETRRDFQSSNVKHNL